MENLYFEQITELNSENLNIIINWMYNWWGKEENYSLDEIRCFIEHSLKKDRLPQTYGLFDNGRIVAMFQFVYDDLFIRPDIYPWLANVYVDELYRNKGVGRILLNKVKEIAENKLHFNELYLYTEHKGLYEKFGWEYVTEIDTYIKNPRIQFLYRLNLK